MSRLTVLLSTLLFASSAFAAAEVDDFIGKPRLVVLTDVGNEPDDQMSFVRLLLYSNEIDIEALIATTSTWQKEYAQPEFLNAIIDGYSEVQPSLSRHAAGFPDAKALHARVSAGPDGYGLGAINKREPSPGAQALLAAALRNDPRPLWIAVWGGANTLAEALMLARQRLEPAALAALLAKLLSLIHI